MMQPTPDSRRPHALGDEQVEQAPFGFGVVGLDEPEALGRPVRRGGPAGDHLEPPVPAGLLLAGVDVATVEADEQGQVRAGQRRPVSLTAVDEAGLLGAELVFQALRDDLGRPTDRRGVQG